MKNRDLIIAHLKISALILEDEATHRGINFQAYRIKLDESCSILGLKKDMDWVLVSSYPDKTLMRNAVAHEMAKQLEYLEYTPTHILIELYLNGEYRGVYTIAEKIEFGGGKIRGYNGWCGVDNTFSYLGKNGKTWYHFLFKYPSFTSRFAERWDEVKDTLLQTALDTIDTQYKAVLGAQTRNFDRWDILNKKIGAGNVDHRTYNTFDLQVEYLREFINTRYNWIDENISEFRLQ